MVPSRPTKYYIIHVHSLSRSFIETNWWCSNPMTHAGGRGMCAYPPPITFSQSCNVPSPCPQSQKVLILHLITSSLPPPTFMLLPTNFLPFQFGPFLPQGKPSSAPFYQQYHLCDLLSTCIIYFIRINPSLLYWPSKTNIIDSVVFLPSCNAPLHSQTTT